MIGQLMSIHDYDLQVVGRKKIRQIKSPDSFDSINVDHIDWTDIGPVDAGNFRCFVYGAGNSDLVNSNNFDFVGAGNFGLVDPRSFDIEYGVGNFDFVDSANIDFVDAGHTSSFDFVNSGNIDFVDAGYSGLIDSVSFDFVDFGFADAGCFDRVDQQLVCLYNL